ncbi:YhgE/Pip domain-containing protein [Paenibacillus sp. FSL R10-2199]|uniref:YhgE/Pip domain-containing protein n=1 Tax=Paenibacillus sp. FSL R10-2199 TaxID=2975348 RepID=UPI0030F6DC6C
MKEIWQIYKRDWLRLFRIPVAMLLIAALVVLPSVYDWVNVAAVWDPYSNTSGIKIAVASLDEGAAVQGTSFNIGAEVLESLRSNKSLGWRFTDAEAAVDGVRRGDYYASIVIPADFSERMTGILEGKLEKPEIEYTVNEKINAIAPKITAKGASTITTQITEHFTETISSTVLTALRGVDEEFQSELPAIRRVEAGLFKLEAELPEIEQAGRLVLKLQQDWPEISSSAERIAGLASRLPEVEQAGKAVEQIDEYWPEITAAAGHLEELQEKLPRIERATLLVSELDSNFSKVDGVLDRAEARLEEAAAAVDTAAKVLPQADRINAAGSSFGLALQQFLAGNGTAFAAVPGALQQNLYLLQQAGEAAVQLTAQLRQDAAQPNEALRQDAAQPSEALHQSAVQQEPAQRSAARQLQLASARLAAASEGLAHTAQLLGALNTLAPGTAGASDLRAVEAARKPYAAAAAQAAALAQAAQAGAQPTEAELDQLSLAAGQAGAALEGVIPRYNAGILPAAEQVLQQLTADAGNAAAALQHIPQRLAALDTILEEAGTAIQYGQSGLAALRQDLPAIREEVHNAAGGMTEKMAAFSNLVTNVLPRIKEGLPGAGAQIHEAAEFARTGLPAAEVRFRKAADFITAGLPRADQGVERAAELVRSDLPALMASVRKAAATLRDIKEEVDLEEIAQLLGGDIQSQSDFLANPVVLKQQTLYPIPNYGSAMTPFYVVLSLWVGGTLLISLLRTAVDTGGIRYLGYQLYSGRLLTFLTVGILQALVAVLGNIFLLGCYVADPVWFVLFAVLISVVFVTIVFTLVSVFGSIGKGIAIVFMVLQFSSSGGTFPISTTGHFFQVLNPFMPFTYAISLLREAVGGLLPEVAIRDALLLVLFGVLALLLGLTLQKPLQGFIRKAAAQAEESKLIS